MRQRICNPFRDPHWNNRRLYEWVAPIGTDPEEALYKIEASIPGLVADGDQNFCVNTSLRPDGSLFISVSLYDTACDKDSGCDCGHKGFSVAVAPQITASQQQAMCDAVGENSDCLLTGGPEDEAILRGLGFCICDAPLVPEMAHEEHEDFIKGFLHLTQDLGRDPATIGSDDIAALNE